MTPRISLNDIAFQAGVSAMTVSRALRNDHRGLPATKKRLVHLAQPPFSYSSEYPEIPGIEQNDALLGSYAADMVSSLFNRSERGVPQHPKVLLCQGEWRKAASAKAEKPYL